MMAGSVAIGALGGGWLDRKWGTEPWLLVVGFFLGMAAGFVELARLVKMVSGHR